jgi:hypothetical protein
VRRRRRSFLLLAFLLSVFFGCLLFAFAFAFTSSPLLAARRF